MNGLVRPRRGKMIAGVCAAIANRFGWPVGLVRLAFVLSCLLPGPQILLYLILWVMIPKEQ
jgi:phage shock protein PspC (stress-responsive transcriptional regulator)